MLKRWWKQFKRSDALRGAGCYIAAAYIRLVWMTGRWEIRNGETAQEFWNSKKPFIISFWHGRMLILPCMWPTTAKMHMLISMHRDGELIARAIGHFGHGTVRGSAAKPGSNKDKGGAAALRGMLKALKSSEYVGITPDGPRGPRMRATDGIVTVARVSGVPVIPCSFGCKSRVVLNTWDRFVIPLPFTRGVITWGDPIYVPRDADEARLAQAKLQIEQSLTRVTQLSDEQMGVETVEPAPIEAAA